MGSRAAAARQYFLGINGEQQGPFSDTVMRQKLRSGEIPPEALVWYDGLGDWKPLAEFPELLSEPVSESSTPKRETARSQEFQIDTHEISTFVEGSEAGEPVLLPEEALLSDSIFLRYRMAFILGGISLVGSVVVMSFYFWAQTFSIEPTASTEAVKKPSATEKRLIEMRNLLSDLYVKPGEKIPEIRKLIAANANDDAAKEGIQTLLDYFRQLQRPSEAADLLVSVKRHGEAAKFYSMEPANFVAAEQAYAEAYKIETDLAVRHEYLLENIKLLLGPLSNQTLAIERIAQLEKDYPGQPHPYGYYLKSVEDRVADLFSRISFHYVKKLLGYVAAELPQISLIQKPLVEIVKEPSGSMRIVGSYRGPVALNKDRMSDIRIIFWQVGERWIIVDTNLTPEREKYARAEKKNNADKALPPAVLLSQMETLFKTLFPKNGLHEPVENLKAEAPSESP